jgi:hypothetical protein
MIVDSTTKLHYEAKVEVKRVFHTNRTDRFVQIHIPNDGLLYNAAISHPRLVSRHNSDEWGPLEGQNRTDVVSSNLEFARIWFGGQPDGVSYYYDPEAKRIDLQYWARPDPNVQDRVYLRIAFEPGFPTDPFDEDTFFAKAIEAGELIEA